MLNHAAMAVENHLDSLAGRCQLMWSPHGRAYWGNWPSTHLFLVVSDTFFKIRANAWRRTG